MFKEFGLTYYPLNKEWEILAHTHSAARTLAKVVKSNSTEIWRFNFSEANFKEVMDNVEKESLAVK